MEKAVKRGPKIAKVRAPKRSAANPSGHWAKEPMLERIEVRSPAKVREIPSLSMSMGMRAERNAP
jgi:hypothetical protein